MVNRNKDNLKNRLIMDRVFYGVIIALSCLTLLPLLLIIFDIVRHGAMVINWEFLTTLPKPVGESGGGIINAIVGSAFIVLGATVLAVPVGILAAVFLYEYRSHKLAKWIRLSVDVIQGTPSIVIGIIAYTWLVLPLGGFSALSGSVALSLMMLPSIIRSTEETILRVPHSLKEAALAMGVPYYRTILSVIIPTGARGILTGIMLSFSRVLGETAPLLFTAFGNNFLNFDPTKPMHAIPLLIYNYALSPYDEWQRIAWGASFFLISIILLLNLLTKVINRHETVRH